MVVIGGGRAGGPRRRGGAVGLALGRAGYRVGRGVCGPLVHNQCTTCTTKKGRCMATCPHIYIYIARATTHAKFLSYFVFEPLNQIRGSPFFNKK